MQTRKVKVLRPFYYNRAIQKQDAVVDLPSLFAAEVIAAKKAEPYHEPMSAPDKGPDLASDDKGKAKK